MALVFPEDRTSYPGSVRFTLVDEFGQPKDGKQVELYLPQGMQIADKVEYENADLGVLGAVIANEQDAKQSGVPASDVMNDPQARKNLIDGLVAKAAEKAGAPFRARTRTTPNPNTRALFKQVSLRSFAFSFKLIPTNEYEAEDILEIVQLFREEMYPEDIPFQPTDGGAPLSLGYRFPDRFEVEMTYDGQTVGPKIAPAYMDSFTTNFNSSSQAFFTGNNGKAYFSEIDINFTLTESKALSRKSIKDGY